MAKLRIGVIGGRRGSCMVNETLNSNEAELVAVCDKVQESVDYCVNIAKEKGVTVTGYSDYDEFLKHDMDAVVLANYANEHAPFAIKALESGKHVMSECLTCATLAEAVALIEAVERTGKIYCYAENYCFFNTTYEMREIYRRGEIGELTHAEGEYVHDCSSIWPGITYGEKDHWRNTMYSTFYCTHSLGPIIYATGLRPVSVSGFETPNAPFMRNLGTAAGTSGMEIVTLENGAIVKSLHGGLKREPGSINYQMYGLKGSMETDRWDGGQLHVYREGDKNCVGEHVKYSPEFTNKAAEGATHGGGDFFTTYYFIKACLGDKEALANCIDVYMAVDMCIPGILAYRSIVNGGAPQRVPNLRLKEERDAYRNDTFCTVKAIAGDMWVPNNIHNDEDIPDEVYEEVRRKFLAGEPG